MRFFCLFIFLLIILNCSAQQHSIGISPYTATLSFKPLECSYPLKSYVEPQRYLSYGLKLRYNYSEKIAGFTAGLHFQYIPLNLEYNSIDEFADAGYGGGYSITTYSTYFYQSICSVAGLYAGFSILLSADENKKNRLSFSGIAQINSVLGFKENKDSVYITKHYYSYSLYPSYSESTYTSHSSAADVIALEPPMDPYLSLMTGLNYNHAFNNKLELDIELLFNFQTTYPLHLLQIEKIKPFVHLCAGLNYRFKTKKGNE